MEQGFHDILTGLLNQAGIEAGHMFYPILIGLATGLWEWFKGRRDNKQLAEIMNKSALKNETFRELAAQEGSKRLAKILAKLLK